MYKLFKIMLLGIIPALLSGCATIVGKPDQMVSISTEPDNAEVVITNKKGRVVHKAQSPTNVILDKADGYFGGETYSVNIRKEGYDSQNVVIDSQPNAWYILGNIGFGGLIGWLLVDPATGSMYKLSPEEINAVLNPKAAPDVATSTSDKK